MQISRPTSGHNGDSFRELIDLWHEAGYCSIAPSATNFCWLNGEGNVLLYDWDRYDEVPAKWNFALFCNPEPLAPNSFYFTYFCRSPRALEARRAQGLPGFSERKTTSIFLGRIEQIEQGKARVSAGSEWPKYIEKWSCPVMLEGKKTYPFTQSEYLNEVAHSRFGLSLPGYGRKCNRDIELLGLGTVPIMSQGLDVDGYLEPLVEGVHFFRARSAEQVPEIIAGCSQAQWEFMSQQCRAWYERNASPAGSWKLAMNILSAAGAL